MVTSPTLSLVLTALFVVTGGWALVRLARVATGRGPAADVIAELSHLLMSVSMIAMAWGVTDGPADPGGVATLVVFGLVALWAVVQLRRAASRRRPAVTGHHLLMAVAMVSGVTGPCTGEPPIQCRHRAVRTRTVTR